MSSKHERPVKPGTIDKRIERREANKQKQPWPLSEIHKFYRGTRLSDKGQYPQAVNTRAKRSHHRILTDCTRIGGINFAK